MSTIRAARRNDIDAIEALIGRSVTRLMANEQDPALRLSVGPLFGVDRQIIDDGTYFVTESEGRVVAAGGWSFRRVLFGGDAAGVRDDACADPARDPAHVRAFYVDPFHARSGLGAALLDRSEAEAVARGFRHFALGATLTGEPFYVRCGHRAGEVFSFILPGGIPFPLRHMTKSTAAPAPRLTGTLPTVPPSPPDREPHR